MSPMRVGSPVAGTVVALTEVPDPVFSDAMVGPGLAVQPSDVDEVDAVSPVDGTVVSLHPHAFVVSTDSGRAVLVHLGIDTVKRNGAGFTLRVAKGDTVRAGQPVIGWRPAEFAAAGFATVCPVIALDGTADAIGNLRAPGPVDVGESLFDW